MRPRSTPLPAPQVLALGLLMTVAAGGLQAQAQAPRTAAACPPLLDKTFPRLQDEKPQSLCQYTGKVLLVVNTASYCGFTAQYRGLEELHARYAGRGLVVLGFPSNDFGGQEPGSSRQIAEFCQNTYGVRFPMFAKSSVRGDTANPLHAELARLSGSSPKWNFHKYLVARDGRTVRAYTSLTAPDDADLIADIEQFLAARPLP